MNIARKYDENEQRWEVIDIFKFVIRDDDDNNDNNNNNNNNNNKYLVIAVKLMNNVQRTSTLSCKLLRC